MIGNHTKDVGTGGGGAGAPPQYFAGVYSYQRLISN